jgi:uncharacterized protein with HEPN domain
MEDLYPKTIATYINRIDEMISKITRYTQDIHSFEEFVSDERNVDMVIPPLTFIGECAGKMSQLYPDSLKLPYKEIIGMRIILTHMYHKIQPKIIWSTIQEQIPALKKIIDEYKANQF